MKKEQSSAAKLSKKRDKTAEKVEDLRTKLSITGFSETEFSNKVFFQWRPVIISLIVLLKGSVYHLPLPTASFILYINALKSHAMHTSTL